MAFSPDGRRLASSDSEATLKIWDAASGREIRTFRGGDGALRDLAFSPDGRLIASVSKAVSLRDADSGQEVKVLPLGGEVPVCLGLAFSPDGQLLAGAIASNMSVNVDNNVKLWDTTTGRELMILRGHPARVFALAFSPDGRRIASSYMDGTVWLWDVATGKSVLTLHGHSRFAHGVGFSPDGLQLATAGDTTVKIWDATPLTPELASREARGVVEFLSARSLPKDEVLARIRRDPTIGESVKSSPWTWPSTTPRRRRVPPSEHHSGAQLSFSRVLAARTPLRDPLGRRRRADTFSFGPANREAEWTDKPRFRIRQIGEDSNGPQKGS